MYIHVHTLYMDTLLCRHIPLLYMPLYAVCTCLYLAVPALNNAMVLQEFTIWYRHGSKRYVLPKNVTVSGRVVAFLWHFPILLYRHHLTAFSQGQTLKDSDRHCFEEMSLSPASLCW